MKYLPGCFTYWIIALLSFGCSTAFKRQPVTQAKVIEAAREEVQASTIALDRTRMDIAAARALSPENVPMVSAEYSAGLAYRLEARAGAMLGSPVVDQTSRVSALLSTNETTRAAGVGAEAVRVQAQSKLVSQEREQAATLQAKGALYEQEHNSGIISRIWKWSIGTLGIGGLIALCVFFPAAIPIMGQLIGWLVSRVPALASWLGVVGLRSYERTVTAIQEIRDKSKAEGKPEVAQFAKTVAAENTGKDSLLVAHTKDRLDYS